MNPSALRHQIKIKRASTTLNRVAYLRISQCQFFSKYISEVEGFLRKQSLKFFMSPLWIQSCLRFATYQKHSTVHLAGLGSEDGVSSTREPPAWDYISMSLCLLLFLYMSSLTCLRLNKNKVQIENIWILLASFSTSHLMTLTSEYNMN